jgi:hypothetical protein
MFPKIDLGKGREKKIDQYFLKKKWSIFGEKTPFMFLRLLT